MIFKNKLSIAALALSATFVVSAAPALAQSSVRVGTLACDVSAGIGLFVVQKQTLRCTFTPNGGGRVDAYTGKIDEFGVALGEVAAGHLVWVSSPRRQGCRGVRSREPMPGPGPRPRLASDSAPMCLPAARGVRSPYSPSRSRGKLVSTSRAV